MTGTDWIAIGRDAGGISAYAMRGSRMLNQAQGADDTSVLAGLKCQGENTVRIGEGAPNSVPCAVLPDAGHSLSVITQDQPVDLLGGWARVSVAGFMARHEGWDGVVCLRDGDVNHWVHVSASEIVSFFSFLTPRLIAALDGGIRPDPVAMADSQSRPERLAAHLRQAEVAGRRDAITGHLIGAELAASRVYWLGQQVGVITPDKGTSAYTAALTAQGVPVITHPREEMIAEGLAALARAMNLDG